MPHNPNNNATTMRCRQYLVRFQDKTYPVSVPAACNSQWDSLTSFVLSFVSDQSGFPPNRLEVCCRRSCEPFLSVRVVSALRGGKGGFGTLLKGQSKQAGAKLTTDFGACRDLQGRRLRHVNDEIKLRKWREMQKDPDKKNEMQGMDTESGLHNWYLMVPSWSDVTKKATRRIRRNMTRHHKEWKSAADQAKEERAAREEKYRQGVERYVQDTSNASSALGVLDAVQQGLVAKRRREKEESMLGAAAITDDEDEPTSLVTLSGDMVVEETPEGWKVQSKSDFATVALMLERQAPKATAIYWEVQLETAGLAQVGWADPTKFHPNTEDGDGVGDDPASFGFDGSRRRKFHAAKEEAYGGEVAWKNQDVIGCLLKNSTISFTMNGDDLGEAFTSTHELLVPTLSCNQGEILELHFREEQMKYMPSSNCVAAGDLLDPEEDPVKTVKPRAKDHLPPEEHEKSETTLPNPVRIPVSKPSPFKRRKPAPVKIEPLDLSKFDSVEKLKDVGMDRLKGALLAIDVKCG